MPQDNEIYKFLKENNLTTKDEKSFLKEYSDSSKAKELHTFMQSNGLTQKDFNSFYDTYLKKKEPTASSDTQSPLPKTIDVVAGLTLLSTKGQFEEIKPTQKGVTDTGVNKGEYDQISVDQATPFARGVLQGELANRLALNQTPTPKQLSEIADINQRLQALGSTDAQDRFEKEGFSLFKNEPLKGAEFLFETIGNSLASLGVAGSRTVPAAVLMGGAGGTAIPGIGTAAGAGSGLIAGLSVAGLNLSTSQKIMEVLTESGIDISDEKSLIAGFSDEKTMAKARSKALKYGLPILLFDVASGGLAGKMAVSAVGKPLMKKILAGTGEVALQSLMGGAGEATGQLASEGKVNWKDVGVEALASIATDVPEIAVGTASRLGRSKSASSNEVLAKQVAVLGKEIGVEDAKMNLERDYKNNVIDEVEYNEGLQFIEKAADVSGKIPENIIGEQRAKSIELIAERDKLKEDNEVFETEKQSLDEAFQIPIDEKIKENQKRIEELNTQVAKISTEKNTKVEPEQISQPIELSIDETTETTKVPIQTETKVGDIETSTETIGTTEVKAEKAPEFVAKSEKYFEYVPIEEIEQYKEFDRETEKKFSKEELVNLTEDIRVNGIKNPIQIKVDRNGKALVVEGNTRLAAAKRLGIKNIPVIVIEGEFGDINKSKAKKIPEIDRAEREIRARKISSPKELSGASLKGFTKVQPTQQQVTEAEPTQEKGISQKGIERAEAKKIYTKVNEIDVPNDAEGIALSYLASGGKVGEAAINEVAGRVKRAKLNTGEKELKSEEAKARDYYLKEGKSLDDIAHELWEKSNQEIPETDIKNALMDAISNSNTRLDAATKYLERYSPEYAEEKYYQQIYEQRKEEVEAEEAEINKWLTEEGETEIELAADEEYINQLIKKYETDLETEIEQPTTESKRTSSEKISSEESGAESKPKPTTTDTTLEPPKPPKPPKETEGSGEKPLKTDNKSILTRIYESENIIPFVKEKFKDKLKYKVSSQDEARAIAKEIIKEYDIDDAVTLAEAGKFDGDVNSFIFAEALDRTYQSEVDANTAQEKVLFAEKWADIAMRYDESARDKGRFIAAIADFYRKSPLGIKIAEEARRSDEFKKWFKNKEDGYKEVYEEIIGEPEFKDYVKEEVQKELKKERADYRKDKRKKIEDTFDGFKINKDALYAIPIPPNLYNAAVEAMKQAFLAGEVVLNAVEIGVEKISTEIKEWDKNKFRKEWEERLRKMDAGKKSKLTPEELTEEKRQKLLDKFRNKLKGLSEKEKDEVIRKSFKKLIENGALEYDDFKQIIAETIGLGELTAEETQKITQLVKDINDVETLVNIIRQEDARSIANLRKYQDAKKKAEKSATELAQLVYNKPNVWRRFLSIMQLSTLGLPSLVNNPIFNIVNQSLVRFPVGVQLTVLDQILYGASKVTNRIFGTGLLLPQNNVALSQKEFIKKLWQGSVQSGEQLYTGLTNKDYFQKEVYSSQIHPFTSARELWDYSFKGKKLTPSQVADKTIQATVGIPAEFVARLLNIGDKPQRYAAEGAQAATFAKNLGLKNITDYEYFLEFPKEEAFRKFKQQGLSDEAAMKKAEQVRDSIVKQGEESVFQQDNFLNDVINQAFKAADRYGTVAGNISETIKKFNFPFLKIPLNAFWSYYNLANPMVALTQSAVYAAKAIKTKSPIDIQQSKKWAAHATTGMALMAIAGALTKEGIVNSDNDDETTKKERMGEQQYEQQKSINITKLKAYLNGQDPNKVENGVNIDLKWLGVMGNLLNIQANKLEEMTPEQKENGMSYMEDLLTTMTTSGIELIDNGVFSNASGLLTAINKGGSFADQYFLNLINMGTNIVQPAMFAQISRAQLPYYSQQKADTFYGQLKNSMLARSGLLRTLTGKYPPSKIGIWGDPMDRSDDVLMKLFSVSNAKKDNFAQPIYEDYKRTGNTKFFPSSVKPEVNNQKLNTEYARKFETLVGQARKAIIAPFIHDGAIIDGFDDYYSKLSDDDKIKALEIAYEQGYDNAKDQFTKLYPQFAKPEPTENDIIEKIEKSLKSKIFKTTIKTP